MERRRKDKEMIEKQRENSKSYNEKLPPVALQRENTVEKIFRTKRPKPTDLQYQDKASAKTWGRFAKENRKYNKWNEDFSPRMETAIKPIWSKTSGMKIIERSYIEPKINNSNNRVRGINEKNVIEKKKEELNESSKDHQEKIKQVETVEENDYGMIEVSDTAKNARKEEKNNASANMIEGYIFSCEDKELAHELENLSMKSKKKVTWNLPEISKEEDNMEEEEIRGIELSRNQSVLSPDTGIEPSAEDDLWDEEAEFGPNVFPRDSFSTFQVVWQKLFSWISEESLSYLQSFYTVMEPNEQVNDYEKLLTSSVNIQRCMEFMTNVNTTLTNNILPVFGYEDAYVRKVRRDITNLSETFIFGDPVDRINSKQWNAITLACFLSITNNVNEEELMKIEKPLTAVLPICDVDLTELKHLLSLFSLPNDIMDDIVLANEY